MNIADHLADNDGDAPSRPLTDVRRCNGCGELKSPARFLGDRPICRDCGLTTCRSCASRKPGPEFRDPKLDPICRDCEVRQLGDEEQAVLQREEQDFLRRVQEGDLAGYGDREDHDRRARRAALAGVSTRRYTEAEDGVVWNSMLMWIAYRASVVLVALYAFVHGVHGGALWAAAAPPELLPIPATILLLYVVWQLVETWFASDAYKDLDLRAGLTDRGALRFWLEAHFVGGLLLPVLIYVLVLVVAP